MPTPERTSLDAIIDAGRDLLEADGVDGLTMQAIADRVGVRAPSLYKRVRNRDELIARIAEATLRELSARLDDAADPTRGADPGAELRLDPDSLARSSASVVAVSGELAGEEHALDAARTFTAWANGFVSMELAGAFRLGGDVDRAFEFGVERLADAVAASGAR